MIYLDNAATSFPKPQRVYRSLMRDAQYLGGNPSRSGHILSARSSDAVYECREAVADLFGARAENVVFTMNATYALNMAIKGVARQGDHFLISDMEHNAVLRPVIELCESKSCSYTVIPTHEKTKEEILSSIYESIRPSTRAIVMAHVSNLCAGAIPVREIGDFCKRRKIVFILDASQSAGHIPVSISDGISFLCAPAHKGLFGIMGLGFLVSDGEHELSTLIEGGSGYFSADPHMPKGLPEHLEAGTLPVLAISALCEGLSFLSEVGLSEIAKREHLLSSRLIEQLSYERAVRLYSKKSGSCVLFNIDGIPCGRVGEMLSDESICVRCGFHCAPLAHKTLDTGDFGAVRASLSFFNTSSDIDRLVYTVHNICKQRRI